jgi:hypothetical protein
MRNLNLQPLAGDIGVDAGDLVQEGGIVFGNGVGDGRKLWRRKSLWSECLTQASSGRPAAQFISLSVSEVRWAIRAGAPPDAMEAAKSERRVVSWLIAP